MPVTSMKNTRSARAVRSGFTLIELLIVVGIAAALLAIAVPNFIKACEISRAHHCISNLRQIEEAKGQWGMEYHVPATGVAPAETELYGPNGYLRTTPHCPSGGTYAIGDLSTAPTCSLGTSRTLAHTLP